VLYYVHNDPLGTPQVLTDEAGTVVWRAQYDPFGKAAVDEDPDGDGSRVTSNVRFPGQYYDQETGLHYNYFRYYDPSTGRYVTADPIGLEGGINSYLYAKANPLKDIDSRGLNVFIAGTANWDGGPTGPPPNFPNGNYSSGYSPQTPGCDRFPDLNGCVKKCCEKHDRCYAKYGCNASSWRGNLGGYNYNCQKCNDAVSECILKDLDNKCDDNSCDGVD